MEHDIAASFAPADIRILKVPHHGSGTSSSAEFLRALMPAAAVISAGRGNPVPPTSDNLHAASVSRNSPNIPAAATSGRGAWDRPEWLIAQVTLLLSAICLPERGGCEAETEVTHPVEL